MGDGSETAIGEKPRSPAVAAAAVVVAKTRIITSRSRFWSGLVVLYNVVLKVTISWLRKMDSYLNVGGSLSSLVGQALQVCIKQMRKPHRNHTIPWTYPPSAFQKMPSSLLGQVNAERFFNLSGRPETAYRTNFAGTYDDMEEKTRMRERARQKKQEAMTKQAQSMLAVTEKMRQQAMRQQIQQNMRHSKGCCRFALRETRWLLLVPLPPL